MKLRLKGTGVAMVTPFNKDKSIDYVGLERLIDYLIDSGVDFLVSMGTTGESAVLTNEEKVSIVDFTKKKINNRVPFVVGIGGNNTSEIVSKLKTTNFEGIEAILSVSPAYNKPTQEGIYQHFKAISEVCPTNIILYNVPGRTSSNIEAKTTLRLAQNFDNITAIKEASGNMEQIMTILRDKPTKFKVLSGDDALTLPLIYMGAEGVISVHAMAKPKEFSEMVRNGLEGKIKKANELHYPQLEIIDNLFAEGNPAGVKACLKIKGICEEHVRLPLINISRERYEVLKSLLKLT